MVKVYISSTYSDLIDARSLVYQTLRSLGHDVIAMEDYVATDQRPLDKCVADVAQSNIYVGIFAWRYGYIPPNHDHSITELEFRTAVETGIPCLLFLLNEEAPWPRKLIDRESQRIEAFRAELQRDYVISFFSSIDELASMVSVAVTKHLGQSISNEAKKLSSANRIVSEAAAMTFVDLMRLLYVRSGSLAFKYNIDRYDEFVDMATDHFEDFKSQLGRFSTSLNSEAIESFEKIERQLMWMLRRLRSRPTRPQIDEQVDEILLYRRSMFGRDYGPQSTRTQMDERLFRTMQTLSEDIHKFCLHSNINRYQTEWSCVQDVIGGVITEINDRETEISLDELWQIRLGIQSEVLKKCQVAKKQLDSIGNDTVYDLSFYYFAIDYYLLPYAIK